MNSNNIKIRKASDALGAYIEGVNLNEKLSEETILKINEAFLKYQVIFFRNQNLTNIEYLDFAKIIGVPVIYPFVKGLKKFPEITPILKKKTDINNFGGVWHSDTSYLNQPPNCTMLYALEVPHKGGDTEFSNQYLAYEKLSDKIKVFLNNKKALNISGKEEATKTRSDVRKHSSTEIKSDELEAIHPVVRTHPETRKKSLYVNIAHTKHFINMGVKESSSVLEFLFKHQIKDEFTYRFKWKKGSIAIWDNRCTMHNPINDYHGERRLMHRITFKGEKPN